MSVAENFSLFPLSKWFLTNPPPPAPNTNAPELQPILSGRIENDAEENAENATGNYTWYRLSHYAGETNTQGKELREYLIILRGVSCSKPVVNFLLNIPDGPYSVTFGTAKAVYDIFEIKDSLGTILYNWSIRFENGKISINGAPGIGGLPNNHSFYFYISVI
jgi:hypothetical protein